MPEHSDDSILLAELGDPHPRIRRRALRQAKRLGFEQLAPRLKSVVVQMSSLDPDNEVREMACEVRDAAAGAAREIGPNAAKQRPQRQSAEDPAALQRLRDRAQFSDQRGSAIEQLAASGPCGRRILFEIMAADEYDAINAVILEAIGEHADELPPQQLADLLNRDDRRIRLAASRAARYAPKSSYELILPLLKSDDSGRRISAAYAIARLGDVRAAQELVALARREYDDSLGYAFSALGELGRPEAIPFLRSEIERDGMHSLQAAKALALIWPVGTELLCELAVQGSHEQRLNACRALCGTGERGLSRVRALAVDSDEAVRTPAESALRWVQMFERTPGHVPDMRAITEWVDQDQNARIEP